MGTGSGARSDDGGGALLLTPAGCARLRERLQKARAAYLAVCADNESAAGAGDTSVWHDNFAYEENQRQMHQWAAQVREIESQLARVRVVSVSAELPSVLGLGQRARLRFEDGSEVVWMLAGDGDGEPAAGRISLASSLGRTLAGVRSGETREIRRGGRVQSVEVIELFGAPEEELR